MTNEIETKERFSAAYEYWISKDAPPAAARDLAYEQIEFEDRMGEPEWKGPNDSLPLHSY